MTTTETKPRLYVGTYAKYNNGSIAGAWMDLDNYSTSEEFLAACAELHKDERDPELMFQDYEGFPREFYNESYLDPKLFEYINMDEDDRRIVDEYVDATGYKLSDIELEDIPEKLFCELDYTYSYDNDNAMGDYVIENGLFEVPDHLRSYIDHASVGREYLMDMSVSSNGYVFQN